MARRLTLCAVCSSLPRSVSPAIRSTIMRKRSLRRLPGSRFRPSIRPSWRISSWYGIITTAYHTRLSAIHQPRSGYARVPTGRRRAGRTGSQLARALAERTDPAVRHRRLPDVLRERGGWDPALYLYCCRDDQQNRGRDQLAGWPYLHGLEPDHPPPMVRFSFRRRFLVRDKRAPGFRPPSGDAIVSAETRWFDRDNVNATLAELNVPSEIDSLSLDVDGNDLYIWDALSVTRPRVLVCEFNNVVPSDRSVTIPYRPDFMWQKLPAKHQFFVSASLLAFTRVSRPSGID